MIDLTIDDGIELMEIISITELRKPLCRKLAELYRCRTKLTTKIFGGEATNDHQCNDVNHKDAING